MQSLHVAGQDGHPFQMQLIAVEEDIEALAVLGAVDVVLITGLGCRSSSFQCFLGMLVLSTIVGHESICLQRAGLYGNAGGGGGSLNASRWM
uniref:RT09856p n=1 Tax=Drosophila melanogaster TaxID=7227 RepID=E0R958_DROME|nr:RT09856p [Drosophila melanogaster]